MIKAKPALLVSIILFSLITSCSQQPVFSQKSGSYDLVKDFNARPDNKTDNYAAFVKAADVISKAGGGVLNIPKGQYFIAAYKGMTTDKQVQIADVVFRNCKNLTIIGNNSVVRLNGNFSRNRDYQAPGLPYNYAFNNTVCPFKLVNCKNVLIRDITLYGEADKMKKQAGVVEGENYGIVISDEEPTDISSKIVLQNITAHHFAADGFLIRSSGEDILINNCKACNNARQGLSIVKGHNIRVLNSIFDSTGKTGAYGWHGPGAGIDIENEFGPGKLTDVLIKNCMMRGNTGYQIVTTLPSERVIIDSCFISDSTWGYSDALNGVGMYSLNSTLSNCILFAGIQVDINDQVYKGPFVQQINNNIIYSGRRAIVSADYQRPVNITGNILVMLPKPKMDDYFPYIQNPNCSFNRNIVVVHADRLKEYPNQVTSLVQYGKEAINDFWLTNGYSIPVDKQRAVSYMTAMNGTKLIKDHFFSPSDVVARFSFNRTIFLTDVQVKEILSRELITAYKQSSLNRKYLLQANELRRYAAGIVAEAK